MKFEIIAPISSILSRTRIFKLSQYLIGRNIDFSFVGWERKKGEAENEIDFDFEKTFILKGGGYGGVINKLLYIVWVIKVFIRVLSSKSKTYYCLGFESALPVYLASKFKSVRYIFDDADRFSMLFDRNIPFLNIMEQKVSSSSIFHIVPNKIRYQDFYDYTKVIEVKNFPSQSQIELSKQVDPITLIKNKIPNFDETKIVVYVNGWISAGRGIDVLTVVAQKLAEECSNICFLVAGNIDENCAKKFIEIDNVHYIGNLKNSEALSLYDVSDYVFTYYKPTSNINCYAESNKWGDAIIKKVRIIVNKEVITARDLVTKDAAVSFDYYDTDSLFNYLITNQSFNKLMNIKIEKYSFEEKLDIVFSHLDNASTYD